jgi:hypothetical protein
MLSLDTIGGASWKRQLTVAHLLITEVEHAEKLEADDYYNEDSAKEDRKGLEVYSDCAGFSSLRSSMPSGNQ